MSQGCQRSEFETWSGQTITGGFQGRYLQSGSIPIMQYSRTLTCFFDLVLKQTLLSLLRFDVTKFEQLCIVSLMNSGE